MRSGRAYGNAIQHALSNGRRSVHSARYGMGSVLKPIAARGRKLMRASTKSSGFSYGISRIDTVFFCLLAKTHNN